MSTDTSTNGVETLEADIGLGPSAVVQRWDQEIDLYEKHTKVQSWDKTARDIIKKLRNEIGEGGELDKTSFNILWANIDTEKAALYSKRPNTVISRREKGRDPITRCAASLLELNTEYQVDSDDNYFDEVINDTINDWQGPGWGWMWVTKDAKMRDQRVTLLPTLDGQFVDATGQIYDPEEVEQDEAGAFVMEEVLDYEECKANYVAWDQVGLSLTPRWRDVRAVWRKHKMTRAQCVEMFGEKIGNDIPLSLCEVNNESKVEELGPVAEMFKRAEVYEIWDKLEKETIWICRDYKDGPCLVEEDKLKLKNFFPCPRPLMLGVTTDSMIPVPQTVYYWGLLRELEKVNLRIVNLIPTIKVGGAVPQRFAEELSQIFNKADGEYVGLPNFSEFLSQNQGLSGLIAEVPIDKNVIVVSTLIDYRSKILEQIYEVRGISDLMRGHSDARETATAQRIKTQHGQMRVNPRQREVQRFCRDGIALIAEVIANTFDPKTLLTVAGKEFVQKNQQFLRGALELLKDDDIRCFRIEIETDSTIAGDEQEEKQQMVESFQTINEALTAAIPAMQAAPELAELQKELLLRVVRTFRGNRHLEDVAEQAFDALAQRMGQAGQQQQQDPKAVEAMQKQQAEKQKQQAAMMEAQQKAEAKNQEMMIKFQTDMAKIQAETKSEMDKLRTEIMLSREKMASDRSIEMAKLDQKSDVEAAKILTSASQPSI